MIDNKIRAQKIEKESRSVPRGQLLQFTAQANLVASVSNTIEGVIPIGRGDAIGFVVNFSSDNNPSFWRDKPYDFSINGKVILRNNPAFLADTNDEGTSGSNIVMLRIPEGATFSITINPGVIGLGAAATQVDFFFSEPMLPVRGTYDYKEYFRNSFPAGSESTANFILPAERGEIVGVQLFTEQDVGDLDTDLTTRATLAINGVELIQDYNPRRYLFGQDKQLINGWVLGVEGGATMTIRYNNNQAGAVLLGAVIYFKETVKAKKKSRQRGSIGTK